MIDLDAHFDIALSYASEDREFVEKIAALLLNQKIKVFYDKFEDIELWLWGKDLPQALDKIYRFNSRFVLIFISKHYVSKMWPKHELKSALSKAVKENREYVLPARFDSSELIDFRDTIGYIDLRLETPESFASKIIKKINNEIRPSDKPKVAAPEIKSEEKTDLIKVSLNKAIVGCSIELLRELERKYPLSQEVVDLLENNPAKEITVTPFQIAKFPVTNIDYWQFVKETGHQHPIHWYEPPYTILETRMATDSYVTSPSDDIPFAKKLYSHPVVHVTYDDAIKYCLWLSKKHGCKYRLPSSLEWQIAARGNDSRIYPWGNVYNSNLCNSYESDWKRTVDVKEYVEGYSPLGCAQMAGNVFEFLAETTQNTRSIAGGSFDAAVEIYGITFFSVEVEPDYEEKDLGFRVCL